jgi:transposase
MQSDGRVEQIAADGAQARERPLLVGTGKLVSGNVRRKNGRDFAAWLDLVPKQNSTGERTILSGISRRGNRYFRTLFVQGARSVLFRLNSWPKYGFAR